MSPARGGVSHALRVLNPELAMLSAWFIPPTAGRRTVNGYDQAQAERPTRFAIWVSAFVFPGAGQFVQRRRVRGTLYMAAFGACLVLLLIEVVGALATNLRVVMDFADGKANEPFSCISIMKVLSLFGFAMVVYVCALADVVVVYRRQCRKWFDLRIRKNSLD